MKYRRFIGLALCLSAGALAQPAEQSASEPSAERSVATPSVLSDATPMEGSSAAKTPSGDAGPQSIGGAPVEPINAEAPPAPTRPTNERAIESRPATLTFDDGVEIQSNSLEIGVGQAAEPVTADEPADAAFTDDPYLVTERSAEANAETRPSPSRWQLDLVVFRHVGQDALRSERWQEDPGQPTMPDNAIVSQRDAANDAQTADNSVTDVKDVPNSDRLSVGNNTLAEVYQRLQDSPAHHPLLLKSFIFDQGSKPDFSSDIGLIAQPQTATVMSAQRITGLSPMTSPPPLAETTDNSTSWPELFGALTLQVSAPQPVLRVDLLYSYVTALPALRADNSLYQLRHIRLQQSNALKPDTLQYFDHPVVAAIANLSEIAPIPAPTTAELPIAETFPLAAPAAAEAGGEESASRDEPIAAKPIAAEPIGAEPIGAEPTGDELGSGPTQLEQNSPADSGTTDPTTPDELGPATSSEPAPDSSNRTGSAEPTAAQPSPPRAGESPLKLGPID